MIGATGVLSLTRIKFHSAVLEYRATDTWVG